MQTTSLPAWDPSKRNGLTSISWMKLMKIVSHLVYWFSSIYLIDWERCPLSLQQRETNESRRNLRTSFDCEDKMLSWACATVNVLVIMHKISWIHDGSILQRQLIGRTLASLHSLWWWRRKYENKKMFWFNLSFLIHKTFGTIWKQKVVSLKGETDLTTAIAILHFLSYW